MKIYSDIACTLNCISIQLNSIEFEWKKMDANWWRTYYKFVCECGLGKPF
jgi:hypothetical protein